MQNQSQQIDYLDSIIKRHIKQKESLIDSPEKSSALKRKIRVKVHSNHNNLPQDFFSESQCKFQSPVKKGYGLQENYQSIESSRQVKTQATEEEQETPTFKSNKSQIDLLFSDITQSSSKKTNYIHSPEKNGNSIFEENLNNLNQNHFYIKRYSSELKQLNSQQQTRKNEQPINYIQNFNRENRPRVMSEDQKERRFIHNSQSQQTLQKPPILIPPIQKPQPFVLSNNQQPTKIGSYQKVQDSQYTNEFLRDTFILDDQQIKQEIYRKIYAKNTFQDKIQQNNLSNINVNIPKNNFSESKPQQQNMVSKQNLYQQIQQNQISNRQNPPEQNIQTFNQNNNQNLHNYIQQPHYPQIYNKNAYIQGQKGPKLSILQLQPVLQQQQQQSLLPPLKHSQSERQHELSAINQQVQQVQNQIQEMQKFRVQSRNRARIQIKQEDNQNFSFDKGEGDYEMNYINNNFKKSLRKNFRERTNQNNSSRNQYSENSISKELSNLSIQAEK